MFDELHSNGLSEKLINLLQNIYGKGQLRVRLPNGIRKPFTSNIGPKQSCNLSPILFDLFVNDINDIFDNSLCQQLNIYQLTLNSLLHADDIVLFSETSSELQNCYDNLQQYCHKWKLTVNIKKAKKMKMIVVKRQLANANSFTFNGNII